MVKHVRKSQRRHLLKNGRSIPLDIIWIGQNPRLSTGVGWDFCSKFQPTHVEGRD